MRPESSVIIPTWNRRDLCLRAVRSVLAQTRAVDEIIVVDDGSTDGTAEALAAEFGPRVRCVRQANAGVAAARNAGLALAQGRYIALLDSDDLWLPEKMARQADWLDAHPDFGMVLCNVQRVDRHGAPIDIFRRRDFIPEDGRVLRWVLRNPALAPVSAVLRREVVEDIGGFDPALATAEDIDFHLRIAHRWPIGVIDEELVRATREHDGLSSLDRTCDDYQQVVERFVAARRGEVPDADLDAGLAWASARNARGLLLQDRWRDAGRLARQAWRLAPDAACRKEVLRLARMALRRGLAQALGRARTK